MTEENLYKESDLYRLLIRIELTFNTYMREAIIRYNI